MGIFDSGVGGLSVARELRDLLPRERLLYIADSKYVPYGNKPPEFIIERSRCLGRHLLARGAKALVIACNTATAAAAPALRAEWPQIPIIGMEPAVKPAVAASRRGVVGVLATVGTLQSARFAALLDDFAKDVQVVVQWAPGLAEAVESGALSSSETRQLVIRYVQPLLEAGVDAIVLGCTHYPFLKPLIAEIAGNGVTLIDTGAAVARQVQRRLAESQLLNTGEPAPGEVLEHFWTTGDVAAGQRALTILWGADAILRSDDELR